MIYCVIFAVLMVLAFLERFTIYREKTYYRLFLFAVLVMYLLGSLRWQRGTDWSSFYYFFQDPWTWWDVHFEAGYTLLNRIVRRITDNYTVFLFIQNAICFGMMINIYKKIHEDQTDVKSYFFILLLYSFSDSLSAMFSTRSQIAGLLCMCALINLSREKKLRFVIEVLIASSFHLMSISFFLALPLIYYKGDYKKYLAVIGVLTLLALALPSVITKVMGSIPLLSRYTVYINTSSRSFSVVGVAKWLLLLCVFIFTKKYSTYKYYDLCLILFTLGVAIYIWSSVYSFYFTRIAGIFLSTAVMMLPSVFRTLKEEDVMAVFLVFCAVCFVFLFTLMHGEYSVLYIPYKSVFDNFNVISDIY